MDIATAITVGKFTVQAVTITKTCIGVYKKADKILKWCYAKNDDKSICVILDSTDEDPDRFVLVNIDSKHYPKKPHKKWFRNGRIHFSK